MGLEGYEDRLRTIGWLLDERGEQLLALKVEGDQAILRVAAAGTSREVALQATDLAVLRCAARGRRSGIKPPALGRGYQGQLRALGRLVDEHRGRACQLRAEHDGLRAAMLIGEGESAAWRKLWLELGAA